ncbi:hypothetical protein KM043_014758 [Ampulex compressa]|nr:hypothetical protein KM043_014758 [Ampulex compressa]
MFHIRVRRFVRDFGTSGRSRGAPLRSGWKTTGVGASHRAAKGGAMACNCEGLGGKLIETKGPPVVEPLQEKLGEAQAELVWQSGWNVGPLKEECPGKPGRSWDVDFGGNAVQTSLAPFASHKNPIIGKSPMIGRQSAELGAERLRSRWDPMSTGALSGGIDFGPRRRADIANPNAPGTGVLLSEHPEGLIVRISRMLILAAETGDERRGEMDGGRGKKREELERGGREREEERRGKRRGFVSDEHGALTNSFCALISRPDRLSGGPWRGVKGGGARDGQGLTNETTGRAILRAG